MLINVMKTNHLKQIVFIIYVLRFLLYLNIRFTAIKDNLLLDIDFSSWLGIFWRRVGVRVRIRSQTNKEQEPRNVWCTGLYVLVYIHVWWCGSVLIQ